MTDERRDQAPPAEAPSEPPAATSVLARPRSGSGALPTGPVGHDGRVARDAPLHFVDDEAPDRLAAVVRRLGGDRPAAPTAPRVGGFGTAQRWTLTRLALPERGRQRLLVRRKQFMAADEVASWATAPPVDAVAVPEDADGLVDGLGEVGDTVFYTLLAGPAPWRALPLTPLPPPFSGVTRPFALGNARGRLLAAIDEELAGMRARGASEAALSATRELARDAVRWLPADDPGRSAVEALATAPEETRP
ncbi:MAG: hypothetical protein H6745_14365 [Deltaproteobacteria bacterium]|nr:hypothetical protein [Deltaproteobacteria bacterium]